MARVPLLVAGSLAIALAGLFGCLLQDPSYDGTAFSCSISHQVCPPGFECVGSQCIPYGNDGDEADAAATDLTLVDAGPDDLEPDADLDREPTTLSFGERIDADLRGVTTDSTLRLEQSANNYGADQRVQFDATPLKVGLLRFDLAAIPAGATVDSAALDLYLNDPVETGELVAYRVLEDWDEGEVSYDYRRDNQRWTLAGAGAPNSASSSLALSVEPRDRGYYRVSLAASVVQAWVDDPSSNAGLVLRSTSLDGRGGAFHSCEDDLPESRPLLVVTFR